MYIRLYALLLAVAPLAACDVYHGHRFDDHRGWGHEHGRCGGADTCSCDDPWGDGGDLGDDGTRPPPLDDAVGGEDATATDATEPVDTAPALDPCDADERCASGFVCGGDLLCQPCEGGVCACGDATQCAVGEICDAATALCVPACASAADCVEGEVCDGATGACRVPTCGEVGDEATCVARADCKPVYSGIDCVDAQGGECTAADTDCTCESFTFAVCIDQG